MYTGLIIKGTIPRVPPFSLWNFAPCRQELSWSSGCQEPFGCPGTQLHLAHPGPWGNGGFKKMEDGIMCQLLTHVAATKTSMKKTLFSDIFGGCFLGYFGESKWLGGGSNYFFVFTPLWGRWTHFEEHMFQSGWFNHQPHEACEGFKTGHHARKQGLPSKSWKAWMPPTGCRPRYPKKDVSNWQVCLATIWHPNWKVQVHIHMIYMPLKRWLKINPYQPFMDRKI